MDAKKKISLSVDLLKRHERRYDTKVPKRLFDFWQSGAALKCEGKATPHIDTPNGPSGRFRLAPAVPSWEFQGRMGGVDCGLFDPGAEFEDAANCIPIFCAEQSRFFVARLTKPECPVGYLEEEMVNDEGVVTVAKSLDAFLASLGAAGKDDIIVSDPEGIEEGWDEVKETIASVDEESDD